MDPIASLLTSIRNASAKGLEKTDVPFSKIKVNVVKVLKDEGFIQSFRLMEENKKSFIRVQLKYTDERLPVVRGIKRISKPGLRIYYKCKELRKTNQEMGISIISTSKGLMTNKKARLMKLGGEVICQVW